MRSRKAGEFSGGMELYPGGRLQLRPVIELQVRPLYAPGIADHFPSVAGHEGAVNDQGCHSAAARGFFKLVSPPAVVRERLPLEKTLILRGRPILQHQ